MLERELTEDPPGGSSLFREGYQKRLLPNCYKTRLTPAYEQRFVPPGIVRQFFGQLNSARRNFEIHRIAFRFQSWFRRFTAALNEYPLPFVGERKIDEELGRIRMRRFFNDADRMECDDGRLQSDPIHRCSLFFHQVRPVPIGDDLQIIFSRSEE